MENSLVAAYDSYLEAERAYDELVVAGFSSSDAHIFSQDQSTDAAETSATRGTEENLTLGQRIRHFFRHMFGGENVDQSQVDIYSEAVRRGHTVLTVDIDNDQESQRAMEVLNRHHPIDIEERAEHWRSRGWSGYDESASALSESEIKQENRDARVFQNVTERPGEDNRPSC